MNIHRRRSLQITGLSLMQGIFAPFASGADATYRRVGMAKLGGTSKQDELSAIPSRLVKVFGQPTDELWDSESLGAFYFLGPNDKQFAVYHRAYDNPRAQGLKKTFWSGTTVAHFSIGALNESGVDEFKAWLLLQLT